MFDKNHNLRNWNQLSGDECSGESITNTNSSTNVRQNYKENLRSCLMKKRRRKIWWHCPFKIKYLETAYFTAKVAFTFHAHVCQIFHFLNSQCIKGDVNFQRSLEFRRQSPAISTYRYRYGIPNAKHNILWSVTFLSLSMWHSVR